MRNSLGDGGVGIVLNDAESRQSLDATEDMGTRHQLLRSFFRHWRGQSTVYSTVGRNNCALVTADVFQ